MNTKMVDVNYLTRKAFVNLLKFHGSRGSLKKKTSSFWKVLIEKNPRSLGGNLIWSCNFSNKDSLLSNIKNNFLVDVLVAWSDFRFQYHTLYIIQLSSFNICFGYNITTPNFLLNQLILIGKVFIFQSKTAEYMPSIKNHKILIKDTEKIERHIALQNNRIDRHIKK